MRYYRIVITDPQSGTVITPPGFDGLLGGASYTSFVNGKTLPGAWHVELDIPVVSADEPRGGGRVAIWGVSLAEISQSNDLAYKSIQVFGGMQPGLPLATAASQYAGLLAQGFIQQAFGNWIGTEQKLELVIFPGPPPVQTSGARTPRNIVWDCRAAMPWSTAIRNALSTAFPGVQQSINISANLVRNNDDPGYYGSLTEFGQYLRQASKSIINDRNYGGVRITFAGNQISVFDGTVKGSRQPIAIAYQDLIGQPTWLEPFLIQFKTVMRSKINVGDTIMLPKTLINNTAAAQSSIVNQRVNFQGNFQITAMRHVGSYREPSADAWVTVFDATPALPT